MDLRKYQYKDDGAFNMNRTVVWHAGQVTVEDRFMLLKQRPATLWLTGLSGAGKSTIACALERRLVDSGHAAYVLDGDNVRHGLNRDLDFSPQDRTENIRRIAEVARLMNDAGLIVITAFISPYREDREMARSITGEDVFLEVHINTPIQVCEERDPKGFYKLARTGKLPDFTGISAPYEPPLDPVCSIDTANCSVEECVDLLMGILRPVLMLK
jgi:adenylyl-sulfate kinase